MTTWTKLPGLPGKLNPCLNCPPIPAQAALEDVIAVGFGGAGVTKDGDSVWEYCDWEDAWQVKDAEEAALKDPDHDWRFYKRGPLHGEVYQRQGLGQWLLVEKDEGFA